MGVVTINKVETNQLERYVMRIHPASKDLKEDKRELGSQGNNGKLNTNSGDKHCELSHFHKNSLLTFRMLVNIYFQETVTPVYRL